MEMTAKQTKVGDHSGGFGCVYIYNSTSGNTVYLYALTAHDFRRRVPCPKSDVLAPGLSDMDKL